MNIRISRRRTTLLVLTDDSGLIRLARSILKLAYTVVGRAPSGGNVERGAEQADSVIVDAGDLDATLRARRSWPDAQVIALSQGFCERDCVAVIDAGADYLPRPFRTEDLAARVLVAELRRFNATRRRCNYRRGRLAFNLLERAVTIDGRPVALGPSEVAILTLLASQPGVVAEHKQLLAELGFSDSEGSRRALRSCVLDTSPRLPSAQSPSTSSPLKERPSDLLRQCPGKLRPLPKKLLRYRCKLMESQAAEPNRLLKLLETANIKLASVASDLFGVSGRAMLKLSAGAASPPGLHTPSTNASNSASRSRSCKRL
jgi:DNA-binding response OmpR family regulator